MISVEKVNFLMNMISVDLNYRELLKHEHMKARENLYFHENNISIEYFIETIQLEVREEEEEYDDLIETVEWLIEKLSDISRNEGKKGIIIQFNDDVTAKKIAGFGNGKIFKKILELANLISTISELSSNDEKTYYILKPVVNNFSEKVKNISIKKNKLKIKVEIELKNLRFIAEYKKRVNFSI